MEVAMYRVDVYKCDTCIGTKYFETQQEAEFYVTFEAEDGLNCEIVYEPYDDRESILTWTVRIVVWLFLILVTYLFIGCSDFIVNERPDKDVIYQEYIDIEIPNPEHSIIGTWYYVGRYSTIDVEVVSYTVDYIVENPFKMSGKVVFEVDDFKYHYQLENDTLTVYSQKKEIKFTR